MALEQTPTGEQNLQICEAAGTLAIDLGSTTTVVAFQSAQTAGPQLLELGVGVGQGVFAFLNGGCGTLRNKLLADQLTFQLFGSTLGH